MPLTDPDRVAKDVGRRLAELRRAKGLTQQAFAERAAVSLKYVQRLEAGRENLTIRSLVWLADLVSADVAQFFVAPKTREVRPGRPRTPSNIEADRTGKKKARRRP